jgi:hypothetical protein
MKRLVRLSLLPLFLAVITSALTAQSSTPLAGADSLNTADFYHRQSFGVGVNAGLISGAGLSGRATFPGGFITQATFFVITAGKWTHFNIGAEAQYSFIRKPDWRLYSMLGMGFYSSTSSDSAKPGNRIANPFRMGLGLGYEWFASDQFVISIGGALTYFPTTSEFLPTPEVGMFWYFQ